MSDEVEVKRPGLKAAVAAAKRYLENAAQQAKLRAEADAIGREMKQDLATCALRLGDQPREDMPGGLAIVRRLKAGTVSWKDAVIKHLGAMMATKLQAAAPEREVIEIVQE
jgi:hypothetical protein